VKALPTLIRVAQRDLDTLRRALVEEEGRRFAAQTRLSAHDQALAREQELARADYESSRAYGGFAAAALQRRRAMEAEIAMFDAEIARWRGLVTEAHVELKKLERLMELQAEREAVAARRADAAAMDEIATNRAARR